MRTQKSECRWSLVLEDPRLTCTHLFVCGNRATTGSQHAVRFVVASLFSSTPCMPAVNDLVECSWKFHVTYAPRCGSFRGRRENICLLKNEEIYDAEETTIARIFRRKSCCSIVHLHLSVSSYTVTLFRTEIICF